jgi:hypothetical protein
MHLDAFTVRMICTVVGGLVYAGLNGKASDFGKMTFFAGALSILMTLR